MKVDRSSRGRLAAWLVGVVFVVSAAAKLRTLGNFEALLVQQGVAFGSPLLAAWQARALSALELGLGLWCLQPHWRRRVAVPVVGVLLIGFSAYLAYLALARPDVSNCGCFGDLWAMSPAHSLAKNVVLLALTVGAWRWLPRREANDWRPPATLMIGAAVLVAFIWWPAPAVPVPAAGTANPTSRFARFADFRVAKRIDVTTGRQFLLFASASCDHCQALATRLAEWQAAGEPIPPVRVVFLDGEGSPAAFLGMTGADFAHTTAPPEVFFQFVGAAPPRLYLLVDGRDIAHWDGEDVPLGELSGPTP